jgi:hypothetical protein
MQHPRQGSILAEQQFALPDANMDPQSPCVGQLRLV